MAHLYRRDAGRPIRNRMDTLGISCPQLAKATRRVDPAGKGVSTATIGKLTGTGPSAKERFRLDTCWFVAEVLHEPLQDLFSMAPPVTVTDERIQSREGDDAPPAAGDPG